MSLERIYNKIDHYAGLGTVEKLRKATGLSKSVIETFLKSKESHTLHKPVRKRYSTKHYHVINVDDLWEADLNIMDSI